MNVVAMKLESRQQLVVTNEEKLKDFSKQKKSKSIKKRNISTCDKDALLNNHGLGRKFSDDSDSNAQNLNAPPKNEICKKNRTKKVSLKVDKMFTESDKIQERLQRSLSNEDKEKIVSILNEIRSLSDVEKLYLYLQLPTGSPFEVDPLKPKTLNPLGKKADEEGMFAVTWIQSHLEEDPDVSLPKQEVYDEYQSYCSLAGTDPLCAADFGKVMKQIFPSVKPRRLGTRGNSRYCYSGLRKKVKLQSPSIPDIQKEKENCSSDESYGDEVTAAACHLLFEWAEKLLGIKFSTMRDLAAHLVENMYVDNRSVAAFTVLLDSSPELLSKGFSGNEGGIKKTEAQFHLQRKIQEKELIKEQKRKLQEQRSLVVTANKGKSPSAKKKNLKSRKSRPPPEEDSLVNDEEKLEINLLEPQKNKDKNYESTETRKCDEIIIQNTNMSEMYEIPELSIKNEDSFSKGQPDDIVKVSEQQPLILASPLSSPINNTINDIEDSSNKRKEQMLQNNNPPVCIAPSLPGIIIVPQIATEIKQNTTPKYKRIQPKPLLQGGEILRSRAGSVGSSVVSSKSNIRSADGRRSSHAWLQSDTYDEKLVRNGSTTPFKSLQEKRNALKDNVRFETPHENKLLLENCDSLLEKRKKTVNLQRPKLIIQSNPQTNEADDNNCFKRHLDENDEHTDNKRFHLDISKLSNESAWMIPKTVDAHLSNAQAATKQYAGIASEEVNVHEIEGDALNDYFRGAGNHNISHSLRQNDLEQQISSNNKVQQLSQLRMLLEQNLPSAISKISPSSIKVSRASKSSDANENVLATFSFNSKKPFLPVLHDAQRTVPSNISFENTVNQSVVNNNNADLNDPQIDNLDKLLSSSYLTSDAENNTNNQLLSDPSVFLNCSQNSIQEMDINLRDELNQSSSTNDILLSSTLMSDTGLVDNRVNATLSHGRISTCTQVPSVPQSPNTRRRAFNFMPISPRHTPIPDGVSMHDASIASSPHLRTMISTGVGPSQPPSNSGSPFVSPRSTPVPLCRSRHSSGQSTYSTSRHTPFQNFDSGVSSVSSSPFISPQPTPVPVSRLRHNSNHGSSKTVTFSSINCPQVIHAHSGSSLNNNVLPQLRIRHNSGPGGGVAAHVQPTTSPSPLIMDSAQQSFIFPSRTEVRSRHNSGSNATTPLSPVSEQASSSSSCASSTNVPDLSNINEAAVLSSSSHNNSFLLNDGAGDLLISANPSSFKQVRHRHVSGSVINGKSSLYSQRDFFSQEIQKLLKNNQDNPTSDLILNSHRSQSVPLHQMLQTADGFCFLSQPFEESCPKSHPSTPVMNQIFSFPSVGGSNQETVSISLGVDREKSVIQNSTMEWTGFENSTDVEPGSSARRNLTALYDAAPLSDDLQTTLEDLRDCDTVFSKLELELRQSEESVL